MGPVGAAGPAGAPGLPGPPGATGAQGPQGVAGSNGEGVPRCRAPNINLVIAKGVLTCVAPPPRFVDNGDGTTTDNLTGLMWEQKTGTIGMPNPSDVHDVNNGYAWTATGTAPDGTLFTNFLATLNGGEYYNPVTMLSENGSLASQCFANHCDWRIPTQAELETILDSTVSGCGFGVPCVDPTFGLILANITWSSSSESGATNRAGVSNFFRGFTNFDIKDDIFNSALAVRRAR